MTRAAALLGIALAACRYVPETTFYGPQAPARPLTVAVDPGLDPRAVAAALELWNDAAGCRVLVPTDEPDADIYVTIGGRKPDADACGAAWRRGAEAFVEVYDVGDLHVEYLALAHELGHALGLGHDIGTGMESSIMAPDACDHDALDLEGLGIRPAWVTHADGAALAGRFCR